MNYIGAFCETKSHSSPLLVPIINQTLPSGLLYDIAIQSYSEYTVFQKIFTPLVRGLWQRMRCGSILDNRHRMPLMALQQLCEIRIMPANGTVSIRPFAQLISEQVHEFD